MAETGILLLEDKEETEERKCPSDLTPNSLVDLYEHRIRKLGDVAFRGVLPDGAAVFLRKGQHPGKAFKEAHLVEPNQGWSIMENGNETHIPIIKEKEDE